MEAPLAYIPMDRRQALARGESLPDRSSGAALFADISGFTPLTEALVRALGPQRGAEELPRQLNLVYDALVAEVDRFGGSVLGFAGDAITCWFDDAVLSAESPVLSAEPAGQGATSEPQHSALSTQHSALSTQYSASARAAACALALQTAMAAFAKVVIPGAGTVSLAIKVGVASGPVRRFLVGDPNIQTIDVLAGDTLQRMTGAEHHAEKGDVLVDSATAAALGELADLAEWRHDEETGERFAVLRGLLAPVAATPWPTLGDEAVPEAVWRPWLLPPVYERLRAGLGAFLTELRPAVALFLRFGGIDYDGDPLAQAKLDTFMLWVQRILKAYDGYMLQLTIGDKGSFFYAALGAPIAHEDDSVRAVMAALELREPRFAFITPVQIGLSQGRSRTGAYGGNSRRTYGVLGDEVNMAARLMQAAPPGQVLVSQVVRQATGERFAWETLPPRMVKGKALPVTPYRLIGLERAAFRLHEPRYALPMVGRQQELAFTLDRLSLAAQGQGQIVGVSAEAGMGKSRLVAEVIRAALARSVTVLAGACQSYGTNTPYLVWQPIWHAFFNLDPAEPEAAQVGSLRVALARINPALLPRLPLLAPVLGLAIPDNDLTRDLDVKRRKELLDTLLVACLQARAAELPLMIVLEDCHWLDALSHDLLEVIGRAVAELPVLIVMAYRPMQVQRLLAPRVTALAHFRELPLDSLMADEVLTLVQLKLAQVFGDLDTVSPELLERVNARAQGNPFYIEELLNYLRDQGLDPSRTDDLARMELPSSLHSLILSRIDRLSESQKSLIKVASVIGRLFRASILWGVTSFFGQQERVRRELEELSALELTPLDTPEPELTYLFKHIVTQEVTYESLPFQLRAVLHEQIGLHLERAFVGREQLVDLLAFHFDRSENLPKRREYLLRAGAAAQAIYANLAAVDYFQRAVPLLEGAERGETLVKIGHVLELIGQWEDARARYDEALAVALAADDQRGHGQALLAIGELLRKRGSYPEAGLHYDQALALFTALDERSGMARTYSCAGSLAFQQGDPTTSRRLFEQCLALRRELGVTGDTAKVLNNLGIVARAQSDFASARALFNESLAISHSHNLRWLIASILINLAHLALSQADYPLAQSSSEEALSIQREVGDTHAMAITLNNLANALREQGAHAEAARRYAEALRTMRALGDRYYLAYLLEDTGLLAAAVGQPERALRLASAADTLRAAIGAPRSADEQAKLDAGLAPARAALSPAEQASAEAEGRAMELDAAVDDALAV